MTSSLLPPDGTAPGTGGIGYRTNFRDLRRRPAARPEDLCSTLGQALFLWWRAAGAPPPRGAFDIADHPGLAAHVFLMRRRAAGVFEYRLSGEEAIRIVGRNDRGDVFRADEPGYRGHYAQYLERVAAGRRPWTCSGAVELQDRPALIPFESLDCPLAGEDGRIAWIVGVIDAVTPGPG